MSPHVFAFERRLPPWIRPTCRGAVCVLGLGVGIAGKLYAIVLVSTLMLAVGVGRGALLFVWILSVTMVAGAAGGTIHGLLRPLEERGRGGSWLRWVGTLLVVIAAAVLLTPRGPFRIGESMTWILAVAVSALGAGLLVWWDARRPGRLTPHQFRWLQNRDQRWSAVNRPAPRRQPQAAEGDVAIDGGSAVLRAARWWRSRRSSATEAAAMQRDASRATDWVGDT